MRGRITDAGKLKEFELFLKNEERSEATVTKYMHDVNCFLLFANGRSVQKTLVMEYKEELRTKYAVSSANSMLAALNCFFRFCGCEELCTKRLKLQRQSYCSEERELTKEEYVRLVNAAKQNQNERLCLILQTVCGTGIRVSELKFITVEAVKRGEATVSCKGKIRRIFIVPKLRKMLIEYAKRIRICSGPVFVTRSGKSVSRVNVWREMKGLCKSAGVLRSKVFPHNLRHLFARTFYAVEKDIAKLADILGHSSINTTRVYVVTTGAEHRRKMENMHLII